MTVKSQQYVRRLGSVIEFIRDEWKPEKVEDDTYRRIVLATMTNELHWLTQESRLNPALERPDK